MTAWAHRHMGSHHRQWYMDTNELRRDRTAAATGPTAGAGNDPPLGAHMSPKRSSLRTLKAQRAPLFLLLAVVALAGCRRDRLFTDDPGVRLSFSRDTVLFDTVFTTVGTVTKRFTARNPNNRAVRVDIAL